MQPAPISTPGSSIAPAPIQQPGPTVTGARISRPARRSGPAGSCVLVISRTCGPKALPAPAQVPVQVIAPDRDPYIGAALAFGAPEPYVRDLRTHTVPGGHWVVAEDPALIARLVTEFVKKL